MSQSTLGDPARLAVLRSLAIFDTPAEPVYDDIAMLASLSCANPVAAVNFVDDERHWTKAVVGVDGGQGDDVAADLSLCASTVCTEGGLLVVPDLADDEHWRSHPFVQGVPHLRFYAGATIIVDEQPVGVVCIFGDKPRAVTDKEQRALIALAGQASAHLELRRQNVVLTAVALTDPLTGLPNRSLLFDRLEHALARRRRHGEAVGVLLCDVDDFKLVNDLHGHEAGDAALQDVARRLREACREIDTVARLGGDEFVVVCPDVGGVADLDAIVQRLDALPDERPDLPGRRCRLSVGAVLAEDGDTVAAVLHRADAAMYRAKAARSAARAPA